jgi:hypothetical protein
VSEALKAGDVHALLKHMTPEERAEVLQLARLDTAIWRPNPGPQSDAYYSEATVIGYGGAAGGGKTDLMCGTILTQHRRAIIFRREGTQLQGIYDRLGELLGSRDGFNSQDKIWRPPSQPHLQIEFGSVPNPEDVGKYQGRPHDLKGFDEATNFLEAQVRFLMGWMRSTVEGQRQRVLLTFNPPTTAEGRWVIAFFAPWLDDHHPNPAKPGEIRWFGTADGKDIEVSDSRPFVLVKGEPCYDYDPAAFREEDVIVPISRTFIQARVTDNPHLMRTGYMATLQSLPEPLRSQMLKGDFNAGIEDDAFQIIPTAWVDQAMARWEAKHAKGPMDSIGLDVARGGRDETVICRRHGTWFDEPLCYPGQETPNGPITASLAMAARRDGAPIHIDVIGWGAAAYDFLVENNLQAIPVNGSNKVVALSKEGAMRFTNHRAELWWRMREALDPTNPDPIALPKNTRLRADLCAPRWELRVNGIQVENKDEIRKRIGRSPDYGDAYCMALIATDKDRIDRTDPRDRIARRGPGSWMG